MICQSPDGAAVRIGERIEGALDDRQQREVGGMPRRSSSLHDVVQIRLARAEDAVEIFLMRREPVELPLPAGSARRP